VKTLGILRLRHQRNRAGGAWAVLAAVAAACAFGAGLVVASQATAAICLTCGDPGPAPTTTTPPKSANWDSFPSDIGPVAATSSGGAQVTYQLPTADYGGASLSVSCAPPSGSLFPAHQTTTVTCTASGLSRSFNVTVSAYIAPDTTPPTITVTGPSSVNAGQSVSFQASAIDNVDGVVGVTCDYQSPFSPTTTTTVTCSASDKAGNKASAPYSVTVTSSGGDGDNGAGGTTTGTTTTGATAAPQSALPGSQDVVKSVIKATASAKPPRLPAPPPPKYGVIRTVKTAEIKNGLKVNFVFKSEPVAGAKLQTTWYYNNKPLGDAQKKRATTIATLLRSSSRLPSGFWRCALRVRVGSGQWRTLTEAQLRLR
jgi:hypothetical protein